MKKNNFFFLIIFFIFFNLISSPVYSFKNTNSSNDLNSVKEIIIALDVTRKKSQQNLININQNASLSKEINETSIFINYLSYQIKNYCSQIYNKYGSNALTDMPCHLMAEKIAEQTSAIYEEIEKEIETSEEQIANLDNEFMNSLGDFDEMLLIEDEMIASQSRKSDSSSMNGGGQPGSDSSSSSNSNKNTNNSNSNSEKSPQSSQQKKDQNSAEKTQTKTTNSSSSAKGNQGRSSKEKSKRRRKLDEIDDDIVARQLKEAAEKETDTELKKRLWDEYYKYKQKTIQ